MSLPASCPSSRCASPPRPSRVTSAPASRKPSEPRIFSSRQAISRGRGWRTSLEPNHARAEVVTRTATVEQGRKPSISSEVAETSHAKYLVSSSPSLSPLPVPEAVHRDMKEQPHVLRQTLTILSTPSTLQDGSYDQTPLAAVSVLPKWVESKSDASRGENLAPMRTPATQLHLGAALNARAAIDGVRHSDCETTVLGEVLSRKKFGHAARLVVDTSGASCIVAMSHILRLSKETGVPPNQPSAVEEWEAKKTAQRAELTAKAASAEAILAEARAAATRAAELSALATHKNHWYRVMGQSSPVRTLHKLNRFAASQSCLIARDAALFGETLAITRPTVVSPLLRRPPAALATLIPLRSQWRD